MSGWTELRELGVVVRPFDGPKPEGGGVWSRFDAGWGSTIDLLADELRHLDATGVVIELDIRERDLRIDGMPRADARLGSPAVRISFESKHGPLRYETAEYADRGWGRRLGWQDNVRAIALSMQALRAVDRYGVSKRGEQYRGWRQIAQSSMEPEAAIVTTSQALDALGTVLGRPLEGGIDAASLVREAQRKTHPDAGGTPEQFRLVQRAKEVLGV